MIRITVELVSAIHPSRNKVLGVAEIMNNGIETRETGGKKGTYMAKFTNKRINMAKPWRQSIVRHYPSKSYSVWVLIQRALNLALEKK